METIPNKLYVMTLLLIILGGQTLAQKVSSHETPKREQGRKGFIIGFGVGPGFTTFNPMPSPLSTSSERVIKGAVMTDFKIGYAPSSKVAIYWTSKVAWFGYEPENRFGSAGSSTHTNGSAGLGFSYFQEAKAPTLFFTGGIGYSTWGGFDDANSILGWGSFLGLGYEFVPHWSLELNYTQGNPTAGEWHLKTQALRFTINYWRY